jgi:DNA-binding LytR/AlgR family response regulator
MKKAIIIEDEVMASRRLKRLTEASNHEIQILAEFTSVKKSVEYFNHRSADLLFLDIQLADGTAFDLLSEVKIKCPIIFITAFDEYAQKAFEFNAFDYLLKPIQKHALESVLDKLSKSQQEHDYSRQAVIPYHDSYNLLIRYGSRYHVIHQRDIAYIYEREGLVVLVNHENETLPLNISLSELSNKLNDDQLITVSSKFLLHLDAIREILHLNDHQVELIIYPPPEFPMIFERRDIDELIKNLSDSKLIIT